MAVARKYIDKKLLHNVIRNTDAHNKIEEEKIMWRIHRVKSESGHLTRHEDTRKKSQSNKIPCAERNSSTHWMKELTNYESSLSDRWGHNGYKELYPEEFEEKTKHNSSNEDKDRNSRRKRKKGKKQRKDKSKDVSKKMIDQKTNSRSPDKKHRKRTSKKHSSRMEDKSQNNSKNLNDSFKPVTRTKKSRNSPPSKKRKISGHKIKGQDVERQKKEC